MKIKVSAARISEVGHDQGLHHRHATASAGSGVSGFIRHGQQKHGAKLLIRAFSQMLKREKLLRRASALHTR